MEMERFRGSPFCFWKCVFRGRLGFFRKVLFLLFFFFHRGWEQGNTCFLCSNFRNWLFLLFFRLPCIFPCLVLFLFLFRKIPVCSDQGPDSLCHFRPGEEEGKVRFQDTPFLETHSFPIVPDITCPGTRKAGSLPADSILLFQITDFFLFPGILLEEIIDTELSFLRSTATA